MKSNPIIEKNYVRSDQDPSQAPAAQEERLSQRQLEEESMAADYGRSSSFVAIDLYGQDR